MAPDAEAFTSPGDCQGGAALAAIEAPDPDYPGRAWRRGVQGWAAVRLDVATDGHTENVEVIEAIPGGYFEGTARRAVSRWRFEPPAGGPLSRCVAVLEFKLGEARIGGG